MGDVDEAELRDQPIDVDILAGLVGKDGFEHRVGAGKRNVAESEVADGDRALILDGGGEIVDGELAKPIDREVGQAETAKVKPVNAGRRHVETADPDATDAISRKHVDEARAFHPGLRSECPRRWPTRGQGIRRSFAAAGAA